MARTQTEKRAETSASAPWLEELEEKVRAAAAALRELRRANQELAGRNRELEGRLAQAGSEGAGDWQKERQEIRERVERIQRHLEELLEEE